MRSRERMPVRVFAIVALSAVVLSGCLGSSCPLPVGGEVAIAPATSCLVATVSACIGAVLNVENKCDQPLLLPTAFAVYSTDASAEEFLTVKPGSLVHFEVRKDKALSRSMTREEYAVPGKLGADDLVFSFSINAN